MALVAPRNANRTCTGALRISETSREVWLHGQSVSLTTQEFELLTLLAHRAGELVSRDEVFRSIRGIDYDGLDRSIDGRVPSCAASSATTPLHPRASRRCGEKDICWCRTRREMPS